MNERLAIVGDIHGDVGRLESLIMTLQGRRLVFVGDYINRGEDPKRTLEVVIKLRERVPETVFLRGNHEQSFLDYLDGAFPFYKFAAMGGLSTLKSYLAQASRNVRGEFLNVFPQEHLRFVASCCDYFETSELIVSHCGIDPGNPDGRDRLDMVVTSHDQLFAEQFHPPKLVICGHHVQACGLPYIGDNVICLDTGCGTAGGPLTALLLPERTFIQR